MKTPTRLLLLFVTIHVVGFALGAVVGANWQGGSTPAAIETEFQELPTVDAPQVLMWDISEGCR